MKRTLSQMVGLFILLASLALILSASPAWAAENDAGSGMKGFKVVIFGCYAKDLEDFETLVLRAKALGATHVHINAEDLPLDYILLDPADDPYPSWAITNPDLLKVAYPEALSEYVNRDYAAEIMSILEARCELLRKYGLKAAFQTYAPQMLPEEVYRDRPAWRGPRVDNPRRARVVRFAPCIDNREVLDLYRESLAKFIRHCPEVEILILRTNDSGAGVGWSRGLYSGPNGNSRYISRPMADRLKGFFHALCDGAAQAGGHIEIDLYNTKELDRAGLARTMEAGTAVDHLEGPDAKPFYTEVSSLYYYRRPFSPVRGIPWPLSFVRDLEKANASKAPRLAVSIGDRHNRELYFRIFERFSKKPSYDTLSRLRLLREVAANEVGQEQADTLLAAWEELDEAWKVANFISTGGTIFLLGGVQQRWITRPFVPFPEELRPDERDYYRRYQFQARTEADADDLIDIQGNHHLHGWSGYACANRILAQSRSHTGQAQRHVERLLESLSGDQRKAYKLLCDRLRVFRCLIKNTGNAILYQALLDYVRRAEITPQPLQDLVVVKTDPMWERTLMLKTAREEIDNTVDLLELIESRPEEQLIDLAGEGEQPYQRLLGAGLGEKLRKKLRIMNDHWEDYRRTFTQPNK